MLRREEPLGELTLNPEVPRILLWRLQTLRDDNVRLELWKRREYGILRVVEIRKRIAAWNVGIGVIQRHVVNDNRLAERSVGTAIDVYIHTSEIEGDAGPAADRGFSVTKRIPGETESGLEMAEPAGIADRPLKFGSPGYWKPAGALGITLLRIPL